MKGFQPDSRSVEKDHDSKSDLSHLDLLYSDEDAPPGDDIEELLWFRGPEFKNPTEFQSRVDKLITKHKGDSKKEKKIQVIVKKVLTESNFLSSVKYYLRDNLRNSEPEDVKVILNDFLRLLSQWFKVGLDKGKILASKDIKEMAEDSLLRSMKYGPSDFPRNFRVWLQSGIPCKDFLNSSELLEEIDSQVKSIAGYDRERSEIREREWINCINSLK